MGRKLPLHMDLEDVKKDARDLLGALRRGDVTAVKQNQASDPIAGMFAQTRRSPVRNRARVRLHGLAETQGTLEYSQEIRKYTKTVEHDRPALADVHWPMD